MGRSCEAFEVIKGMPALGRFSHEFFESVEPEAGLVSRADVIFACVPGAEGEAADGMAAIHAETTDGESMRNVTADDVKVHAGGGSLAEMARVLLAGKQDGACPAGGQARRRGIGPAGGQGAGGLVGGGTGRGIVQDSGHLGFADAGHGNPFPFPALAAVFQAGKGLVGEVAVSGGHD